MVLSILLVITQLYSILKYSTLLFLSAFILIMSSCKPQKQNTNTQPTDAITTEQNSLSASTSLFTEEDANKALAFINSYVDRCNQNRELNSNMEWVYSSKLTTPSFNATLKAIIDQAYKDDPELGLEADPIFDAQDYPEAGFELDTFDKQKGALVVKGKNWADFRLALQLVKVNGATLVDGCGSIRIPENERTER